MEKQHPAIPASPQFQSGEENNQKVPSGSFNLLDQSSDAPMMSPSMTPQEKIEKLRRRQQMRAILAIRKQQQQFRHRVSCNDNSVFPRCSNESQTQFAEADKNTMEDTILHQLEDVIARLDIRIRLWIRDSLFRLAQSAIQRKYAGDTSSNNKISREEFDVVPEEGLNSQKSSARVPDVETETNPIDRAVAHLLFHRPLELSRKLPPSLKSPPYTEFPCETKGSPSTSVPMGFLNDSYEDDQSINISYVVDGGNGLKKPCMDASENAFNNKTADGGVMEVSATP